MNIDTKINVIIDGFIKKILESDNKKLNLEEKIANINLLLDNLIDLCIKQKIFFYIENKIGYKSIVYNFKYHLIQWIQCNVDPYGKIISKYIGESQNKHYDNVSDINSLMFRKFKNFDNFTEKNVSFKKDLEITNYEENNDGFEFNLKTNNSLSPDISNIGLYIKILINQNKFLIEFIDKLNSMCKILSDPETLYKKSYPFDNFTNG